MRTEKGTTYNAYLLQGENKTALIETVKIGFADEMFEKIRQVTPLENIDYIICNHLEPDHSGSVFVALEKMPNARVVVAKNGENFLKEITNAELNPLLVATGDSIDLGGKTLRFITAPFLHWPDTMFTYCPEDKILFSCDFLGSHYCDEEMLASKTSDFGSEFKYYYEHIMRPFKEYVLKALDEIEELEIDLVCTSHGPILDKNHEFYIRLYKEWSSEPKRLLEGKLMIFYVSAYGFTAKLAKAVSEGAEKAGVRTMLIDLVESRLDEVLREVEEADGLAIGSCTINGDAVKPVWDLLSSLATIKLKGKWSAAFGSYGWSGEAVPMIEERLRSLKMKSAGPGFRVKFSPTEADINAARDWGRQMGEKIKEAPTGGILIKGETYG